MAVSADTYGPYDSGAGANMAEDSWRKMMRHMLGSASGVIRGFDNECNVFADSTGMQVKMQSGQAFIRGQWGEFTSQKTLPISAAHATLARKDRVILRNDFVNNRIEVDVLTGTAAASPAVPTLTQSSSVWETSLAVVSVAAAASTIAAGNVADDRMYTSVQGRWEASGAQSVADNTFVKIQLPTQVSTSGDLSWDSTNHQWTLLRSGLWITVASLRFASNTTGKREVLIADPATVSGATCSNILSDASGGGYSGEVHLNATTANRFSAGQVLAMYGFQNSGGALNTVASSHATNFSMVWVGP